MPAIHRSVATLRIIGDNLDPDQITKALGVEPTSSERKGDVFRSKSGKERIAKKGMWRLEATDQEPADLDLQVNEIFDQLTDDLNIWTEIMKVNRSDLFVGLFMENWNEGIDLEPETLKKMGDRRVSIGLDIYGPTEDDNP